MQPSLARRIVSAGTNALLFTKLPSTIRDLLHGAVPLETNVVAQGWIRSVRRQKQIAFAKVNDGSSLSSLQAVLKPDQALQRVFPFLGKSYGCLTVATPI